MGNEKEKIVDEQEPQIPVFKVLKNGAILKNIFIVNKPPPPPHYLQIAPVHQETEEILIVGRQPDCNIMLNDPIVSRFHLQIVSNPSSHKLYLTNLIISPWDLGLGQEDQARGSGRAEPRGHTECWCFQQGL